MTVRWGIIGCGAAAGLPRFVAFYRRRLPRFLKAKEWVDSGRLGRVRPLT